MKKSVLSVVLLLAVIFSNPFSSISQETDKKEFNTQKTEFNIAITNIFAKNELWPYYYIDGNGDYIYSLPDYSPRRRLLVGLKFHNPKGAVRLGTTLHYTSNKHTDSNNGDDYDQKTSTLETGFYLGYQWQKTITRVNIFYGLDGSVNYFKNKFSNSNNTNYDYENSSSNVTIALSPLLGVNCFITPNLSIGTEVKLNLEYTSGKHKNEYQQSGEVNESKSSGFRARFGPLGFLSINIHF